jgi:cytoplasmic iron level regulating protein YaaA (DUF328/UPF0246 family)
MKLKIVLSPAKSLDWETPLPTSEYTHPAFLPEAERLGKELQKKSQRSLSKLMNLSTALAELNWARNQNFSWPQSTANARPAVYSFNGDVYQGLDMGSFPLEKLSLLQDRVWILSGLYGLLRPLDLIQPYRLEMGTSLRVNTRKNLYEYWKKKLTAHVNQELTGEDLLVNLASKEYFSALDAKQLKAEIVTPQFRELKNGKLQMVSFFAKQARGKMARFIVEHELQKAEDLLGFDVDGYRYSEEHSKSALEPMFIR